MEDSVTSLSDLELFSNWVKTGSSTQKKTVFKLLLNFVCCKSWEALKENHKRAKVTEKWAILRDNFRDFLVNYPKTMEGKNRVLKIFENSTWPAGFIDFTVKEMDSKLTAKFKADHKFVSAMTNDQQGWLAGGKYI
jgi:hypothetical protein